MTKISQNLDRVFNSLSEKDWSITLQKNFGGHSVIVSKGGMSTTCKINDLIADLQTRTNKGSLSLEERKAYRDKIDAAIKETEKSTGLIHRIRSSVGNAVFGRKEKLRRIAARIAIDDFFSNRYESMQRELKIMEKDLDMLAKDTYFIPGRRSTCSDCSSQIQTIQKYLKDFPEKQDKTNQNKLNQLQKLVVDMDATLCKLQGEPFNSSKVEELLRDLESEHSWLFKGVNALLNHDIVKADLEKDLEKMKNLPKELNQKKVDFDKRVKRYHDLKNNLEIDAIPLPLRLYVKEKIAQGDRYIKGIEAVFEKHLY